MSADAGFDFNMQAIRMGLGMNRGGGGGDPVANEKDMLEYMFDSVGSGVAGTTSILTGAPNKGEIFSVGIQKQFELPEGFHEKMINPYAASFGTPGGFLYRMFSALIKNGNIESQAEGIEPIEGLASSDYGDGGGGDAGGATGDSGGDYGGGGGSATGDAGIADMFGEGMPVGGGSDIEPLYVEYGGHRYEAASMGEAALGDLTPSSGTDVGSVSKGDIEIG